MKFSIIVPIYNVEKYLDRCIQSIIDQTYTDFELILIDDGSPDNCPKMCDEWATKDNRIKVIHKENGGLSSARNAGLDIATGKYVYFVDSDDYIESNLLQLCVEQMDKGYDIVCFRNNRVYNDGSLESVSNLSFYGEKQITTSIELVENILDFANHKITPEVWNKMFVRDIIEKYNIRFVDTKTILCEDTCFCICYASVINKIYSMDTVLYNFLQRNASTWALAKNEMRCDKFNELLKEYYLFLCNNNLNGLLKNFYVIFYEIYNYHAISQIQTDVVSISKEIKRNVNDYNFIKRALKNLSKNRLMLYLLYARRFDDKDFVVKAERQITLAKCYVECSFFKYRIRARWGHLLHGNTIKKVKKIMQNKKK